MVLDDMEHSHLMDFQNTGTGGPYLIKRSPNLSATFFDHVHDVSSMIKVFCKRTGACVYAGVGTSDMIAGQLQKRPGSEACFSFSCEHCSCQGV